MLQAFEDKYEHVGDKPLGTGACGATWKVKVKGSDGSEVFCSKEQFEDPDLAKLFKNERDALSVCDHPNVTKYYDAFGEGEGGSAMVIEFIDGMTLNEANWKDFPTGIPKDIALDWMIQMASAIKYLHVEKGMLHRDLHGGNWMVTKDHKKVTLIDFGTAIMCGQGKMLPKTFAFHAFKSPQTLKGLPGSFDGDIWYLGMIFFSFVNNKRLPWNGYSMDGD